MPIFVATWLALATMLGLIIGRSIAVADHHAGHRRTLPPRNAGLIVGLGLACAAAGWWMW